MVLKDLNNTLCSHLYLIMPKAWRSPYGLWFANAIHSSFNFVLLCPIIFYHVASLLDRVASDRFESLRCQLSSLRILDLTSVIVLHKSNPRVARQPTCAGVSAWSLSTTSLMVLITLNVSSDNQSVLTSVHRIRVPVRCPWPASDCTSSTLYVRKSIFSPPRTLPWTKNTRH